MTSATGPKKEKVAHVGDNPMEGTLRVAKSMLSRRELAKVPRRTWHLVIKQAEHDFACRL